MPTKCEPETAFGKPTIETNNHDRNVGQRESSHSIGEHGKPTLDATTHDSNYGQRDVIDEEETCLSKEEEQDAGAEDEDEDEDEDEAEEEDDIVSRADRSD